METWLEVFKAQQTVKSGVENTPWLAMLTGVVATGVLLQIVKFVSNLAGTVIDPKKWLGKVFNDVRVHADAQNLFVITPYTGVDPETDSYTAAYPNVKTFTVGLNVIF